MVDLKCKCGKCEFNDHCNCYARHIIVTRTSKCGTFTPSIDQSKTEFSDEIAQPLVRPSVEVLCQAKCLFNKQGKCLANGISVMADSNSAECGTYLPK